jgi:hypothetical protein
MKRMLVIALALVLILGLFVLPALAQDPTPAAGGETPAVGVDTPPDAPGGDELPTFTLPKEVPATAQEGLEIVKAFIWFLSSVATIYTVKGIKLLPFLDDGEKSKLSGLGTDAVAGFFSLVFGVALAYGAIAAGFLDSQGFWSIIKWAVGAWPTTFVLYNGLLNKAGAKTQ